MPSNRHRCLILPKLAKLSLNYRCWFLQRRLRAERGFTSQSRALASAASGSLSVSARLPRPRQSVTRSARQRLASTSPGRPVPSIRYSQYSFLLFLLLRLLLHSSSPLSIFFGASLSKRSLSLRESGCPVICAFSLDHILSCR